MEAMTRNKMVMIQMMKEEVVVVVEEKAEVQIAKLNRTLSRHQRNHHLLKRMKIAMGVYIQSLSQNKETIKMMRDYHGINLKSKLLEVIF